MEKAIKKEKEIRKAKHLKSIINMKRAKKYDESSRVVYIQELESNHQAYFLYFKVQGHFCNFDHEGYMPNFVHLKVSLMAKYFLNIKRGV